MTNSQLIQLYSALPQCKALSELLNSKNTKTVFLQNLVGSAAPLLFSTFSRKATGNIFLFVLSDADEAGYFYHDLTQLLGNDAVLFFPSSYRRAVKYGQRDAANEILRTEVLARLAAVMPTPAPSHLSTPLYIVAYPEALSELVVSQKQLDERIVKLAVGQTVDIVQLEQQLREFGFTEVDYVYEPGQFARRGSILDVYSFSCELPFRIDFFGDEIDTIRTFEVEDQLSKDKREQVEVVPELSNTETEKVPFLSFLPNDTVLVTRDFHFVRETIGRIYEEGFSQQAMTERLEGATEMEQQQIMRDMQRDCQLTTAAQFADDAQRFRRVEFGTNPSTIPQATIEFHTLPQPLFHKNMDLLKQTFEDYQLQNYRICVLADSQKQQERIREILTGITLQSVDFTLHEGFVDADLKTCFFTDHQIFDRYHKYNLKSDAARNGKMALTMKELQEMEVGDYLVHVDYGIGKFGGLVRIPITDPQTGKQAFQEVIRIVYQHNDKVDVSIHSLYKISKYRRNDTGEPPRLSILGSGAWERLKERTKTRIKDIARDLIKLYAKRRSEKGFQYSADSFMQHELEASFLYEDTPDQLKATAEVKADMESAQPMDRLVCGDVGFGKTEVAVRAAFKAACDSKQVAVLVPTTVLAYQHYQTFSKRLQGMPVRVEYLSRARSAKKTKELLADLKEGRIDILIGTHKLIGKQVQWKDLGLLIIDEEQKFGVSVKEKLRQLKTNIDTLTMSATPIPRTLQFSLMGARDMSIMRTPPPNRHPIHTELGSYNGELIADAISFEMSRNGQAFFVNDRISNLPEIERLILKYVPDCRVAIGHGQMKPEKLEEIIMGFINYDYDVLLSTTIVENGIDVPNANTIIINDAHHFGLSDLHQMRGRVGRSNRKAFCYLLAPPKAYLSPEARRRLEALETFSGLGSGFSLAMQDLDIRGAGNLLGAEQSGFMEDLGYETYLKIIKQAMAELRNESPNSPHDPLPIPPQGEGVNTLSNGQANGQANHALPLGRDGEGVVGGVGAVDGFVASFVADCSIESDLPMYFPDTYVPGSSERMLLYRELDNIEDDRSLEAYRQRLIDRFGPVPHEGEELMQVVLLRRLGKRLGCEKIIMRQGIMNMQFVSNANSPYFQSPTFGRIIGYATANLRRCQLKEVKGRRLLTITQVPTVGEAVRVLKAI